MLHKSKAFKRLAALILAAVLVFALAGAVPVLAANTAETWAIYMYICGSDLETDAAAATKDILEMLEVNLPENVTVVMLIGGARQWWVDIFNPALMYTLVYNSEDLFIVEEKPCTSMGDPGTLEDFLVFCETYYPADHKALLFWDHGGGSGTGICFDELYDFDYLTLAELRHAFTAVYGEPGEPVFELIGFDACLMATVDVAGVCYGYANYLVASQEVEPGCGWSYDGMLGKLAENPGIAPLDLARGICDSYYDTCEALGIADMLTLSVIDLSEVPHIQNALDSLSYVGILTALSNDPAEFFAEYGRGAKNAEYYGGGYFEMVDLISLVKENLILFPESGELLIQAVEDSVVYQVTGPYRANSHGLSAYFPYELDVNLFINFFNAPASPGYGYLYELLMMGLLTDASVAYFWDNVTGLSEEEKAEIARLFGGEPVFEDTSIYGLEDAPVYVYDFNGATVALLDVDPESAAKLREVALMMYAVVGDDEYVYLGDIADSSYDWEAGLFLQGFYGMWGTIDGCFVLTQVESVTDDYILYSIPIFLNDRQCDLTVAYIVEDGSYHILSATPYDDGTGIPSKEQLLLMPGDEILTIFASVTDGNIELYAHEQITVTEDTAFYPMMLPDGYYGFLFTMTDYAGNLYSTSPTLALLEDGRLTTYYQLN